MTTTTLDLKVTADAKAAVSGLKPLNTALERAKDEAQDTEQALNDLGDREHKIKIDDDAVDRARREITRLRAQIRDDLRVDVNADTKTAERRIRELSRSIKAIDNQEKVEVKVDVDKTGIGALGKLKSGVGGLGGPLRALGSGVAALTFGLSALGVAGVGAVGWTLGLADGLANAKIAFTQFLGSGQAATKFLETLQAFSAKTPFEFPELVDSSKKMLAFGINAKDVIPILTSLGDAAALTGADVGDLTTIWGQMAAKGKVGNEELLQLTEAGVPAYGLLAEKMGKTTGEIQKMAEKGKLLSGNVLPVLKGELDKTFGGGMEKQAKTLGGMFSTLKDSLGQLGTQLGQAFTPVVGQQIELLTGQFEEWGRAASENKEKIVIGFSEIASSILTQAALITQAFAGIIEGAAGLFEAFDRVGSVLKVINPAAALALKGVDFGGAADGLHNISDSLGEVSTGLRGAADDALVTGAKWAATFRESDNIQRAKNDLKDLRAELRELRKQPPSPKVDADIKAAEKKIRQIKAGLKSIREQKTATRINVQIDKAKKSLTDWRASLKYLRTEKPTTEVKAKIENAKKKIQQITDKLKALRKQRADIVVSADTKGATKGLGKLTGKKGLNALIGVVTPNVKEAKGKINDAAKKRTATINTNTKGVEAAKKNIDGASKKRAATINVGTSGVQDANKRINDAARDRTSTIYVKTVGAGRRGNAGPTNDAPGALSLVPQLFGTDPAAVAGLRAVARAAPQMVAATTATPQTVATAARKERAEKLRPRQTPVQVFLDGAVIADQISLRNDRMAVASTTRRRGA